MLPRSPPLPFTQRICLAFPSSGSTSSSFELVLPPPKFVILRSEPRRLDRYLNISGASSFAATASSQRSSRNRRSSRITRHTIGVTAAALPSHLLDVAALREGLQRLRRKPSRRPPLPQHRSYILPECAAE